MPVRKDREKLTVYEEYLDLYTFETIPVSNRFLDMLAVRYREWITREKGALVFTEFLEEQFLPLSSFYRWLELSPKLKAAHKHVLMIIGNRRDKGATIRAFDGGFVSKTLGFYSDVFVQESNRLAELAQKNNISPDIDVYIDGLKIEKKESK